LRPKPVPGSDRTPAGGLAPALPPDPNGGSILTLARTPYAIDRLLELGVASDVKDRWATTPIEAMTCLGPAGADIQALDREHRGTPESWARIAIDVTNNSRCARVADYLSEIAKRDAG
jgi:hypothetical protein